MLHESMQDLFKDIKYLNVKSKSKCKTHKSHTTGVLTPVISTSLVIRVVHLSLK